MNSFDVVWSYLQGKLLPGTKVKNWTIFNGYLGDTMTIDTVDADAISVDAPVAKYLQIVPREDFELVWGMWEDYKHGKVKRNEVRDTTHFSKYIISILHWYEQEVSNA